MSKLFYNIDNIVTSPTAASVILSNEEYSNLTVEEYELRLSIEGNINKLNYYNDQLEASIEEYEAVSYASGLSTEAFLETAKSTSRRLGIPIDTVNISSEGLIQGIANVITGIIKVIWKVITAIWDQLLKILGIRSNKADGMGTTNLRGLGTYLSMASSTLTFLVSGVDGISAFATKLSEVHRDYNKLQLDLLAI